MSKLTSSIADAEADISQNMLYSRLAHTLEQSFSARNLPDISYMLRPPALTETAAMRCAHGSGRVLSSTCRRRVQDTDVKICSAGAGLFRIGLFARPPAPPGPSRHWKTVSSPAWQVGITLLCESAQRHFCLFSVHIQLQRWHRTHAAGANGSVLLLTLTG